MGRHEVVGTGYSPLGEAPLNFPNAASLLSTLYSDKDFTDIVDLVGPIMVRTGSDDADTNSLNKSTSALYSTGGALNSNTYNAIVNKLINYCKTKGAAINLDFRIMWLDANKNVGFDSSKCTKGSNLTSITAVGSNVTSKAFPKIYEPTNNINENHVGRVEMGVAERAASGIAFNHRFSGTLKKQEARVVIALKNGNMVTGLLSPSVSLN